VTTTSVNRELLFIGHDLSRPRMTVEQDKLRAFFPGMQFFATNGRVSSVQGYLKTNRGTSYHVRLEIPSDYPLSLPTVFLAYLIDAGDHKHMWNDGSICIMRRSQWSSSYSLALLIARTAKWANKYEIWKYTGSWPGSEQAH
jgi:hypothetical protein